MRLNWVQGALVLVGALLACGPRASAPPVQRAQPAPTPPASASAAPTTGAAVKPGYVCPPAPPSTFSIVPQGGIFGNAEIQVSKDGRIAAARPTVTEIQIWNVPAATKVGLVTSPGPITRMSLRPDGRALAILSEGRVLLKDLERGTLGPLSVPGGDITAVDWSADSKLLFVSHAAQVDVVDAGGNAQSSLALAPFPNGISPDGRWVLARDGAVWDVKANQQKWKI